MVLALHHLHIGAVLCGILHWHRMASHGHDLRVLHIRLGLPRRREKHRHHRRQKVSGEHNGTGAEKSETHDGLLAQTPTGVI